MMTKSINKIQNELMPTFDSDISHTKTKQTDNIYLPQMNNNGGGSPHGGTGI